MSLVDAPAEPKSASINGEIVLFVRSSTDPHTTCGALIRYLEEGHSVVLRAVGAGAVNQAVKAVAIARQHLIRQSKEILAAPGFEMVSIEEVERTAVVLRIVEVS